MFKPIITILGPTATGKTKLAVQVALQINGEIVSADSRQVYRRMDIGTGKDIAEYSLNGKTVPFHMIDIVEPGLEYNVFQYQKAAVPVIKDIQERGKTVVLCGGSGMYIDALLKGYKLFPVPENELLRNELKEETDTELEKLLSSFRKLHNKTDIETRDRLLRALEIEYYYQEHPELQTIARPIPSIIFGLKGDRDFIRQKITKRLKERLQEGMIDEVASLIETGANPDQLIRYGLEYKYITLYLQKELDYETMFNKLNIAIHQFSKRQMTWFRKMERDGFNIHWIDIALSDEEKCQSIKKEIQLMQSGKT